MARWAMLLIGLLSGASAIVIIASGAAVHPMIIKGLLIIGMFGSSFGFLTALFWDLVPPGGTKPKK